MILIKPGPDHKIRADDVVGISAAELNHFSLAPAIVADRVADGGGNPPVALRYNEGKLPLSIVPPSLDAYVAAVMEFGSRKYAKHNWRKGFPYSSILDSLKRHLAAFESGEDHDSETGLHHLAHIATNVAFLIEHVEQGYGTDDRLKLPAVRPSKLHKPAANDAAA